MIKSLPTLKLGIADLNAFRVAAREGSITHAARLLHTSQSALSRRLRKLEERLQVCLLVRGVHGVIPTESGRKLLRHVDALCLHEQELIAELRGRHPLSLYGVVRIAGSASMVRGVALPALAPMLRANQGAHVEFQCDDGPRVERLLAEGRADVVLSASDCARRGHQVVRMGTEVIVLLESARHAGRENIYLESGLADEKTEHWISQWPLSAHRRFACADASVLATSIALGVGRGALAVHRLDADSGVRRVPAVAPLAADRWLHHLRETLDARLVAAVVEALVAAAPDLLARDAAGMLAIGARQEAPTGAPA